MTREPTVIGAWVAHPAADLLPMMSEQEFADLCDSVRKRGLERPILLCHDPDDEGGDGRVLDGRNRLRACLEVGVEPRFDWWEGPGDPFDYVWAHNVARRHLAAGQRVMLLLDFQAAQLEAAAERRQRDANAARAAALKGNRNAAKGEEPEQSAATLPPSVSETEPADEEETTRADVAKRAAVSPRTAQKAITLKKQAPDLAEQVSRGEKELEEAYRQHKGLAQHSSASVEWYTPPEVVDAARRALGGKIDCDPASCAQADEIVCAGVYYTEDDNGLAQPWTGSVFLNPPGGLVAEFWNRLLALWRAGYVERALWIGFSLEQLQSLQKYDGSPLDFPICFPRKRIAYVAPGGGKLSPTHASYVAFLPGKEDERAELARFAEAFAPFGRLLGPRTVASSAREAEDGDTFLEAQEAAERPPVIGYDPAFAVPTDDEELPHLDGDDWMGSPAGTATVGRAPAPMTKAEAMALTPAQLEDELKAAKASDARNRASRRKGKKRAAR